MNEIEQYVKECKEYNLNEELYYKNTMKILNENPNLKLSIRENYKTSNNISMKYYLDPIDYKKWLRLQLIKQFQFADYDEIDEDEVIWITLIYTNKYYFPCSGKATQFITFQEDDFTNDFKNDNIIKYGNAIIPITHLEKYFELKKLADYHFYKEEFKNE